jgi:hypothetical protein
MHANAFGSDVALILGAFVTIVATDARLTLGTTARNLFIRLITQPVFAITTWATAAKTPIAESLDPDRY